MAEEEIKSGKPNLRRELPPGAAETLKAWLLSPEHFTHPYPTPQDQVMLMQKTGLNKKQLKNWFTNARRRIWRPMLEKQSETRKVPPTAAAGASGGAVSGLAQGGQTGPVPTTDLTTGAPAENSMSAPYPPGSQPSSQPYEHQYDQYDNPVYNLQESDQPGAPEAASMTYTSASGRQYYPAQLSFGQAGAGGQSGMAPRSSIGSLVLIGRHSVPGTTMSRNIRHAVLMELLARDQDLYEANLNRFANATFLGSLTSVGSSMTGSRSTGATEQLMRSYTPELDELVMWNNYEDVIRLGYVEQYLEILEAVGSRVESHFR